MADEEGSGRRAFVLEEAFALDEPRDAEGDDGDGLEPEESCIPVERVAVQFPSAQKAESDTYDDCPSAEVIKLISPLFLYGAEVWREITLGELVDAEEG